MKKEQNIIAQQRKVEASLVAASTLVILGVSSGELTYARALRVYGDWFRQQVEAGRITPCRYGAGEKATRWFSVQDILASKAAELEAARLILSE